MTALLIVGAVAAALWLACWWADRQPPAEPEQYPEISHVRLVRLVKDQEHSA